MLDFIKLVNDGSNEKKLTDLANKTILQDLYDKNLRGQKRAVSLNFWEDEKAFESVGKFIPGCFYIFKHQGESLTTEDGRKEFHDILPIFLSLRVGDDKGRKFVFGINFNILTKPVRAAILQELYNMDRPFFDNLSKEHIKGRHVYSKTILSAFAQDSGMRFCDYICTKYRIKKESIAFRKYYFDNILRYRMIDYWQWKYLPFLDVAQGVRGVELSKLQKDAINK